MYVMYWIHREGHRDMLSEGYVGITKDFTQRMYSHKKLKLRRNRGALRYAIAKYGWENLIKSVIGTYDSLESALEAERKVRPTHSIGWNSQRGGELGVEPEWYDDSENRAAHSKRTSDATKLGIAKEPPGARSERQKKVQAERCKDRWAKWDELMDAGLTDVQIREITGDRTSTLWRYRNTTRGRWDKSVC